MSVGGSASGNWLSVGWGKWHYCAALLTFSSLVRACSYGSCWTWRARVKSWKIPWNLVLELALNFLHVLLAKSSYKDSSDIRDGEIESSLWKEWQSYFVRNSVQGGEELWPFVRSALFNCLISQTTFQFSSFSWIFFSYLFSPSHS